MYLVNESTTNRRHKEIYYVIMRSDGKFINMEGNIRSGMSEDLLWEEKAIPENMVNAHNNSVRHKYEWYLAKATMEVELVV
jgi:hypothetical protein